MTITSLLLHGLRILLTLTAVVFITGVVAGLLGAPKPLANIIAIGVGVGTAMALIDSLRR